jgi:hypothetical protein
MAWQQVLVAVAASLVSGLLGVGISTWYYRRHERRRARLDTVSRLFGFRFDIQGREFSRALNEVFVVSHDAPRVIEALPGFHEVTVGRLPDAHLHTKVAERK